MAGTSKPPEPPLFGNEGALLQNGDADEVFAAVEAALRASGVRVDADTTLRRRTVREEAQVEQQLFHVAFPYAFPAEAFVSPPEADTVRTVAGWIVLSFDHDHGGTRLVEDGGFAESTPGVHRSALTVAVRRRVLDPIATLDSTLSRL